MNVHYSQRVSYVIGAVTIGDYSFNGAGAIVKSNILDFSIAVGTPDRGVLNVMDLDILYL